MTSRGRPRWRTHVDQASAAQIVEQVKQGYAFSGPAIQLGALVVDGTAADPTAQVRIPLEMVNRHGLVAGATGTGKTKTLQRFAEQLSENGVPVFLADIKGDLSGVATAGTVQRQGVRAPPRSARPGRARRTRRSSTPSAARAPASRSG